MIHALVLRPVLFGKADILKKFKPRTAFPSKSMVNVLKFRTLFFFQLANELMIFQSMVAVLCHFVFPPFRPEITSGKKTK